MTGVQRPQVSNLRSSRDRLTSGARSMRAIRSRGHGRRCLRPSGLIVLIVASCASPGSNPDPLHVPTVARVICSSSGAALLDPVVSAQRDGVHIRITNELAVDPGVEVSFDGGGLGENAPPGTTRYVWPLPPGAARVQCGSAKLGALPGNESVDLHVSDPHAFYVPTRLDCAAVSAGTSDYAAGTPGAQKDVVLLTRHILADTLQSGDVVEPAGYPNQPEKRTVRVVRDGQVIASVTYEQAQGGGWLQETVSICSGS
jgi:hypothetical protein